MHSHLADDFSSYIILGQREKERRREGEKERRREGEKERRREGEKERY